LLLFKPIKTEKPSDSTLIMIAVDISIVKSYTAFHFYGTPPTTAQCVPPATFCRRRQNVTHNLLTRWNPIRL